MDIRALRYFQTVAESGSYSRGSELLRISQPAVSRTIRNLEDELGRPVFKRHGHGVTLTEAGKLLLERSQLLLRQLEQTKADIRSGHAGLSGVISFAVPPAAGHFIAPPLVERFGEAYPHVFLKIVGGFSGYIHEWLVRGQVDLACLHDPVPQRGFEVTPLLNEEVYLVGRAGSLGPSAGRIRTEDLAKLPLVLPSRPNASRRLLDKWTAARGISLSAKVEVDDTTITRAMLRQGVGFSLLTRGAIEDELSRGELEIHSFDPPAYWPFAMLTCQNVPRTDIQHTLIGKLAETVKEVVRDLVESGVWSGELPAE
ncbi:MAG: LysR family transcriptional regulator [Rhizobiales bacterium]|nr:LysR family transcriptional regulator [Hyphomicrobiales bacterium]